MSGLTKKLRTRGNVRVVVGDRDPKLFVVPQKAADGVVELLRPYAQDTAQSIPADEVFSGHYRKYGKAGAALQGFRSRDGLTQVQLARKLGVTQGDVSAMEHGRRPIGKGMASRLARIFKTDYRVFL